MNYTKFLEANSTYSSLEKFLTDIPTTESDGEKNINLKKLKRKALVPVPNLVHRNLVAGKMVAGKTE